MQHCSWDHQAQFIAGTLLMGIDTRDDAVALIVHHTCF
jgi:hypothetical protein